MVLVRYYGSKSEAQWICVVFTTWHFSKIKISNKKKKLPPIQSWLVLHIIMKREFKVFSVLVES